MTGLANNERSDPAEIDAAVPKDCGEWHISD
jgi:hypothetical protein